MCSVISFKLQILSLSSANPLAGDFTTTKVAIGNPELKVFAMLSVNATSQDLVEFFKSY